MLFHKIFIKNWDPYTKNKSIYKPIFIRNDFVNMLSVGYQDYIPGNSKIFILQNIHSLYKLFSKDPDEELILKKYVGRSVF